MRLHEIFEAITSKARPVKALSSDDKELIKLIKGVCPNNFEAVVTGKAVPLYRGTEEYGHKLAFGVQYIFSPGREEPRVSKTGSNIIMNYTMHSPAWKNVPRRALSISAATNKETADRFEGSVHLIIPADNVTKFAFMPKDFNEMEIRAGNVDMDALTFLGKVQSFIKIAKEISDKLQFESAEWYTDEFRELMSHAALSTKFSKTQVSYQDIELLSDFIEQSIDFQQKNTEFHKDYHYNQFISTTETMSEYLGARTLIGFLKKFVSPEMMKITVVDSYKDVRPKGEDPEVWFEGPYLAFRPEVSSSDNVQNLPEILKPLLEKVRS